MTIRVLRSQGDGAAGHVVTPGARPRRVEPLATVTLPPLHEQSSPPTCFSIPRAKFDPARALKRSGLTISLPRVVCEVLAPERPGSSGITIEATSFRLG